MINIHNIVSSFLCHKEYIALVCFVFADYLVGFGLAIKDHRLSSAINYKGVVNKIITLTIPVILYPFFYVYGLDAFVRVFVFAFIIPNVLSLVENLKKIGITLPDFIVKFFENAPDKDDNATKPPDNNNNDKTDNKE